MNHSQPRSGAPATDPVEADEALLRSLHAALPLASVDPDFGNRYDRFVRRLREARHPLGVRDIRTVRDAGLDVQVDLGDPAGCDLYYGLVRPAVERALFLALLQPGDAVVDVGVGFGLFSLPAAARVGRGGIVHALKGDPVARALLDESAERNGLADRLRSAGLPHETDEPGVPQNGSAPGANGLADVSSTLTAADADAGVPIDPRVATAIDALGADVVDVVRVAVPADRGLPILRAMMPRLERSSDPMILWSLEASGPADAAPVRAFLDELADAGFELRLVDRATGTAQPWSPAARTDATGTGGQQTLLLIRQGGVRDGRLRALLEAGRAGHDVTPVFDAPDGAPDPSALLAPTMTAVAVAALRDLDRMASALHARLAADGPDGLMGGGDGAGGEASTAALQAAEVRIADLQLALDRESTFRQKAETRVAELERRVRQFDDDVRRLIVESDQRLSDARTYRREVKQLRARREVAVGQWLRGVIGSRTVTRPDDGQPGR